MASDEDLQPSESDDSDFYDLEPCWHEGPEDLFDMEGVEEEDGSGYAVCWVPSQSFLHKFQIKHLMFVI